MAIVKQGSTTLNSGAKGDKGIQGDAGVVQSIAAGTNVTVDSSNPANPIISSSGGGGASNPNINPVTSLAELLAVTGVNEIIDIQEPITLLANYQIPSGQQWIFSTGYVDIDTFQLDLNGASLNFNSKLKGLDLSDELSTVIGTVTMLNDILYASNIGALDNDTLDNFTAIKNAMHIVNQNSSTLYFNKQTATNIYYMQVYNDDHGSPFFVNGHGGNVLLVGNGNNNVTVTADGTTVVRTYAEAESGSAVFVLYNTENSSINNITFRGDRYTHFYDQRLRINTLGGATSNGVLTFRILEFEDFNDTQVTKTVSETIPITIGNQLAVANEIVSYLNGSATFIAAGYSARVADEAETPITDTDERVIIRIPAGTYGGTRVDGDTSGAAISADSMLYEWGHCLVIDSMANNCDIGNLNIQDYHGDGIAKSDQGNGTTNIQFDDLTNGIIDESGVATNGDNGYYYMTDARDMPSPHEWFTMSPFIGASVYLQHFKYYMAYYDDTAINGDPSVGFIAKSGTLQPYDYYEYPSNFKKYRLILEDNGEMANTTNSTFFVNSPSRQRGGVIHDCTFKDNRRHAITNVIIDMVVERNHFYRNSGVSPEIDLNIEDWGKTVSGQIVRNNTFTLTNIANISIKGANRVEIYGNRFLQGSYTLNTNSWDTKPPAILTSFARNTQIHGNYFVNRTGYIDILTNSHNNHYTNSRIGIRSGSAVMHNETFVNSTFGDGTIGGIVTEGIGGVGMSHIEDCKFYINEGWGNTRFSDEANTLHHKNMRYYFNEAAQASNHALLVDESLRWVYWNSTSSNYLGSDRTTLDNGEHEGTYNGIYVYGAKVAPNLLHRVGWTQYAAPTKDFYLESSLNIQNGYEKSFKIKDGEIQGWFWLELGEFPTDGLGTFKTITIENVDVIVPPNIDANEGYLNNAQYGSGILYQNLLRVTQDININLIFKNCNFISEDTTTGLFMYLGNRGTTDFIDCSFEAPTPLTTEEVINFNTTGSERSLGIYTSTNTGVINMRNVKTTNISFVLRSGDILDGVTTP